jgi:MFS family permease
MAQAFALAALVLTHRITYPWLILLSVISGMIDALEIPSRQSFVIDMVGTPGDLGNAIALNSSLVNAARLVGPAVAGLLIAAVGEGWCFFINGVSYLAVIVSLLSMQLRPSIHPPHHAALWETFKEGFTYAVRSVPIVTLLSSLAVVSLLGSSYTVLIPIFAAQGTVLGLGRVVRAGMIIFGSGLIVFSFSRWFWMSWAAMLASGFGMMIGTASINTMLQTIVEPDKRGRVMSFFTTAFIGMSPLGNLWGGALASRIGAPLSVRLAGGACLAAAVWYTSRLKILREHIRPIYHQLGILPEVASGLQAAAATIKLRA